MRCNAKNIVENGVSKHEDEYINIQPQQPLLSFAFHCFTHDILIYIS